MLMTTPTDIRLAACRRYFRMIEILRHWSMIGKKVGKGGQSECVGAKESKECSPSMVGDVALPRSCSDLHNERRDRNPCVAGEEGGRGHVYAYVGVLAVDGEGRDST